MVQLIFRIILGLFFTLLITKFAAPRPPIKPNKKDELNTIMVALHNEMRGNVLNCTFPGQPPAAMMRYLTYSQLLANKAHLWAKKCKFGHDSKEARATTTKYKDVGQNIALAKDFTAAFFLWLNESKFYNFTTNKCLKGSCENYTQIVWARTKEIGCGYAECPDEFGWSTELFIVCNYGPAGNTKGKRPYKEGSHDKCKNATATTTTTTNTTTTTTTTIPSTTPSSTTTAAPPSTTTTITTTTTISNMSTPTEIATTPASTSSTTSTSEPTAEPINTTTPSMESTTKKRPFPNVAIRTASGNWLLASGHICFYISAFIMN